jgi:hypothetical protein
LKRFDGDPEKLAQYIVALSKKFENDESSKQRFIDDLKVFLEAHTETFVDKLFHALVNKTYERSTSNSAADASNNDNKSSDEHSNRRKVSLNHLI